MNTKHPKIRNKHNDLESNLEQLVFGGLFICILGFSLYFRVFLPMSLWSVISKPSSQSSAGFLFFTSEEIDPKRNSSCAILISELSFLSGSANAEVYADVPLRTTTDSGQTFFVLQVPGKAVGLDILNVFAEQDMNRFNGTTGIVPFDSNRVSYIVVKVPRDNVSDLLSLHLKFGWSDFSNKISVNEYTFTASFDTTLPQFFDAVRPSLGISGQENVLLPEAATTYRFSLARPKAEILTEAIPTADNIVFNGSNVWLLWDVNRRSDSKRFVSTAVSLEASNESERTLYDISLTFFLFLIGLGIPMVISAFFEYSKSLKSFGLKPHTLRRPSFVLLLLIGVAIVVFEALHFFSLLNLFDSLHGVFMLLLEISFYVALGFWLGEVGFVSIGTSIMVCIFILFDQVLYFRLVADFSIAATITCLSFILGELVFLVNTRRGKKAICVVEVFGSLLNPREWDGLLANGSHREVGKEKRVGWKLSFDKMSSRRKEAVLNLVQTENAQDIYYTTLFEVDNTVYEALLHREMGKAICEKWKRGETIPDTSYRPVELDSHYGKAVVFTIPEAGRVPTPTTSESKYVRTVKKGIEALYQGEMRDRNLKALEGAVNESARSIGIH